MLPITMTDIDLSELSNAFLKSDGVQQTSNSFVVLFTENTTSSGADQNSIPSAGNEITEEFLTVAPDDGINVDNTNPGQESIPGRPRPPGSISLVVSGNGRGNAIQRAIAQLRKMFHFGFNFDTSRATVARQNNRFLVVFPLLREFGERISPDPNICTEIE